MAAMARRRSNLAALLLIALASVGVQKSFVPSAPSARAVVAQQQLQAEVLSAAIAAAAALPSPVLAARGEDDEEGFDVRIIIIAAPALVAVSWALFNVWRVLFRQTVRIGESASGSSKLGLGADD
eukprot:TRINITY_DN1928_c2_g1_i1.p1 TRINITY_DN1928_c2_g1~~TRINITY_DN1928_c2_g1_i1.p1  ORF type:complete len:125 (-),score=36.78 TRINITY_DN1928_c2_g1_i1:109-483(-)